MVRFCDKDIVSANYDSINRQGLLRYFLRGHIDDMVCVFNADNMYIGNITYHSLLYNSDLDMAIDKEMLVLNEDVWSNARKMFKNHRSYLDKYPLLPVVNDAGQLISFAYEEGDANRELRQLRELMEESGAVQFRDIYSEYDCVIIYGFNELAYFFVCYLKAQGIPVRVEGAMWEGLLESDATPFMEHRCMKIYAEGTWEKPSNWEENLLRSVSVEFECIDVIYEENIRRGYIKDAIFDYEQLLAKLKNAEAVAVLGTDVASLDAYDFLVREGVDVECFIIGGSNVTEQKLFGKPIYNKAEVIAKYGNNIVLVDNHCENSTWGVGGVDYMDYIGYKRNVGLIALKDYVSISGNGLQTALKNKKIVMTGDICFCERLQRYLEKKNITGRHNIMYMNLTDEVIPESYILNMVDVDMVCRDTLCLIVLPEYLEVTGNDSHVEYRERKADIISNLRENKFVNYTEYFSMSDAFINIEKENYNKYPDGKWKVKRIVLGSIETRSGNQFFCGLLDNHPSIMLTHESPMNGNIFWLCILLADRSPDNAISLLETLNFSKFAPWGLVDKEKFIERMRKILRCSREGYTSQELFVIIHAVIYGKGKQDISNMIIYWEPHGIPRNIVERYALWLGSDECPCDIINVVRNAYISKGSNIKRIMEVFCKIVNFKKPSYSCQATIRSNEIRKGKYAHSKRISARFEDLKCNPVEELQRICKEWEIPWADSLLEMTVYGEKRIYNNGRGEVKDFDLGPVYNLYEEYLSEFDRFRITVICAPWQKRYGYPYADINLFTRKELQEMFLKKFKFMDMINFDEEFEEEKDKLNFFIRLQNDIRGSLQMIRMTYLFDKDLE